MSNRLDSHRTNRYILRAVPKGTLVTNLLILLFTGGSRLSFAPVAAGGRVSWSWIMAAIRTVLFFAIAVFIVGGCAGDGPLPGDEADELNPYAFPNEEPEDPRTGPVDPPANPPVNPPTDPPTDPPVDPPADPPGPPADPPDVEGDPCVLGDIEDYPPCCDEAPARCVPLDNIAPIFHDLFAPCGEGSICVAEPLFARSGSFSNKSCSSVAGDGGCITRCTPFVGPYLSMLNQDVCGDGEVCAPCISPLDGTETGACRSFSCDGVFSEEPPVDPADPEDPPEDPEDPPEDPAPPEASCENPPEAPLVDVSIFKPCCDGAHCVPTNMVPGDLADELDPCPDGTSVCVPDPLIETMGFYTPPSCELPGGIEGRCLSTCLPSVAETMDLLPQSTCAANERCSPCCDPMTGEETGACDVGCDEGPAGACGPPEYTPCCGGEGHCIPEALIPPDDLDSLSGKECAKGSRCVPDKLQDPAFQPATCSTSIPFVNISYEGVCLPKCLDLPIDFSIVGGNCDSSDQCVPCKDPWVGLPLGAPGCD